MSLKLITWLFASKRSKFIRGKQLDFVEYRTKRETLCYLLGEYKLFALPWIRYRAS